MATLKNRADATFRALSDMTRLRIIALLIKGETCVCDIVDILKIPQPRASRHLAYLRQAGLVQTRKDRQWIYYQLVVAKSKFRKSLLVCLGHSFDDFPQIQTDTLREQKLRKEGSRC